MVYRCRYHGIEVRRVAQDISGDGMSTRTLNIDGEKATVSGEADMYIMRLI